MSQSPPSVPPQQLNYAQPTALRSDLRTVAVRQRAIMYCILGYIASVVCQFVLPPPLSFVFIFVTLAMQITALVFLVMLALTLFSTASAVLMAIGMLIPLVNLIILLSVNGKATRVLREHGIKVGLMGARLDQIPAPGTTTFR